MKFKVGTYFIDYQPLYVMLAKVVKIDGVRVYFKPLNFDDWDEKLDWFHCGSMRAEYVHIIGDKMETSDFEYWLWKNKNKLTNKLFKKYLDGVYKK